MGIIVKRVKQHLVRTATAITHGARKTAGHAVRLREKSIVPVHTHLVNRISWYKKWHEWRWHKHTHVAVVVVYIFWVALIFFSVIRAAFAADLSNYWDFSNQSEYTIDSGVEFDGNSVRLKAQEYTNDANTAALFKLNETSGTSVADSSSNGNNGTTTGSPSWGTGNLNNSLTLNGTTQHITVPDSASMSLGSQQTIEGWIKPSATFDTSATSNQTIFDKGSSKMFLDRTTGKLNYEIANNSETSWTQIANSRGQNGSWNAEAYYIEAQALYNGDLIVGTNYIAGAADVWRRSGSTWTRIGGDGLNGSWSNFTYEGVYSLAVNGDNLYAGLGASTADAEIWTCSLASNCNSWSKIGGDTAAAQNTTGITINHETVRSMVVHAGTLYVGAGESAGDADVWRYDGGTSWTQIGGDALNSSWAASTYERVHVLASDGTNLYAGLGSSTGDSEVWRYNGTSWTLIGGDGVNSSWANSTYEYVTSLNFFGGNLYAGTGLTAGDAEVWRWDGTSWTLIGGDGVNSSWANSTYEYVGSMANDGTNLYIGLGSSGGDGEVYRWSGSAWTKIGGDNFNSSFGGTAAGVYSLVYDSSNSKLYAGVQSSYGAHSWEYNGTSWSAIGGSSIDNSWANWSTGSVNAIASHNGKVYFGLGAVQGSAIVYEYDGTNYTAIGGNGTKGSWSYGNDGTYERVWSLVSYNGQLYAGLGDSGNDGEVWRYNGSTWTQVGGDGLNDSWTSSNYTAELAVWNGKLYATTYGGVGNGYVYEYNGSTWTNRGGGTGNVNGITNGAYSGAFSLVPFNDRLCMGFGQGANMADVWCWTGTGNWTQVGGDGLGSSWNSSDTNIWKLAVYNGQLIAGTTDTTNRDPAVWVYNGSSWTKLGGGGVNGSWNDVFYCQVRSFAVYNGELYTGMGYCGNNGHVWKYNGSTWSQVAGDNINSSWGTTIESVRAMGVHKGRLYAGLGDSGQVDALVYVLGNNTVVESSTSSFNADWTHVAATYNGVTAKVFVNGVEVGSSAGSSPPVDNSLPVLIGASYGNGTIGDGLGRFAGSIDEMRFSNIARTGFTTNSYTTDYQGVKLNAAVRMGGIHTWDGLASSETTEGGAVTYRLSDDGGVTWKYWTGSSWANSTALANSNPIATINSNIASFPATFKGITWQAVLKGNGSQRVQLNSVTLTANSDTNPPVTNASSIVASKTNGGAALASNGWTNGGSPFFSWTAGADAASGILGYCLYLGQTPSADPVTTKGVLGTGSLDTGGNCQFGVSGTDIDLAASGVLNTPLTTSNTPYYLNIKAIDRAGNVHNTSAQFQFRFDNTPPTNPGFISAPSGIINTKSATFTWPTTGPQAADDAHSGLAGLQYRIGSGLWYGDSHTGTGDAGDLLANDGSYTTTDPPDYQDIVDGVNTVTFRAWDQAGNVTSSYASAALRVNTSGAPSEPLNLIAAPSVNTTNEFTFSWDPPTTFNTTTGEADRLKYCYTVNALPTVNNCNFTDYAQTSVGPDAFATQPGDNTFYVVAKDDFNAINYASLASITFTANTPSPGMPLNIDVADVSVKTTSNWRLAVTWDEPSSLGAGVAAYRVYRSTSYSGAYSLVGSSSSTSYVDAGLSQIEYFYKVSACDSANNCGAESGAVSETPTGKFTSPAALVSEPSVTDVTTRRASITWSTGRDSDSKIAIGAQSGVYSASEIGNSEQTTDHVIDLDNLAAGTTYYYKAKWTDEDGNTGQSQEYTFTTAPAPVLKEVVTQSIGLDTATIQFTTKDAAKVDILFGRSDAFGGIRSVNTSLSESSYQLQLPGLDDGTKYFYKITMYDSEGGQYQSSIFSFSTPPRPRIANLSFQPVEGEPTSTQRVTWTTNVAATSQIIYGKIGGTTIEAAESVLKTEHEIIIRGLDDNSEYGLTAQSRDGNGNLAVSDRQVFKTALDTRPPKIFDIAVESVVRGSGSEARGQIIVTWKTDEPATSQVQFSAGASSTDLNNQTVADGAYTTDHIAIISDLSPSKSYNVRPVGADRSGNRGVGGTQSTIIGRATDSVISIIFSTLQRLFGFAAQ